MISGRKYGNDDAYRYGFNGKEKDNEVKGQGNSYDFGARMYDSRLGRWLSIDRLAGKYPYQSPYDFAVNNPIVFIDIDGNEILFSQADEGKVFAAIKVMTAGDVKVTFKESTVKGLYKIVLTPIKGIKISPSTQKVMQLAKDVKHKVLVKIGDKNQTKNTQTVGGKEVALPTGVDLLITYDPDDKGDLIENTDGTTGRSPFVGAFHEFLHALKIFTKKVKKGRAEGEKQDDGQALFQTENEQKGQAAKGEEILPIKETEIDVRKEENVLRKKLGEKIRRIFTTKKLTPKELKEPPLINNPKTKNK